MAHPRTHAESSARKYGGVPEDYIEIHDLMDSSKSVFPDNRHRALTHNSWFFFVVEKIFGHAIDLTCTECGHKGMHDGEPLFVDGWCRHCNGMPRGKGKALTRYICEQHVLEDFGNKYIPTASDYLEGMEFQPWMNNGIKGSPTSHRKLASSDEPRAVRMAFTLD